jgi:hypothetical protein
LNRRLLLLPSIAALVALTTPPTVAQIQSLYTRHPSARVEREAPIPDAPQPGTLTADQNPAIAPVHWPAVWPAPKVPAGTVLNVPLRPNWQPQPGEYWGPFTDDTGAWGFMIGPHPDGSATATALPVAPVVRTRFGAAPTAPPVTAPPSPPAPPVLPVAGPVSPDGQMVVSYPDGKQAAWQLPMVSYKARLSAIRADGALQLTDAYGRQGFFTLARNARIRLNGQPIDRNRLPVGAAVTARALRLAPTELTVLEAVK